MSKPEPFSLESYEINLKNAENDFDEYLAALDLSINVRVQVKKLAEVWMAAKADFDDKMDDMSD
jgi:hypothetical protein